MIGAGTLGVGATGLGGAVGRVTDVVRLAGVSPAVMSRIDVPLARMVPEGMLAPTTIVALRAEESGISTVAAPVGSVVACRTMDPSETVTCAPEMG